jgi:hypothetical protein
VRSNADPFLLHARSFANETLNMAMQILARNRTKSNPENKVGTNNETLVKIPCECIGGSEGYRAQEICKSVCIDEVATEFPSSALATKPTWFCNCVIEPVRVRPRPENLFQIRRSFSARWVYLSAARERYFGSRIGAQVGDHFSSECAGTGSLAQDYIANLRPKYAPPDDSD